jgi:hypothetical protein
MDQEPLALKSLYRTVSDTNPVRITTSAMREMKTASMAASLVAARASPGGAVVSDDRDPEP